LSVNDVDEILNDDSVLEEPKSEQEDLLSPETKEKPVSEGEEIEELEDENEQEKEPELDENELQLATPVPRKAILAKYPNVFKDFPYLDVAYQRDKQYTDVFATPREAKEAAEAIQSYENLQNQVFGGDISEVLRNVKDTDDATFKKIVDNYLPALNKVDPAAYMHIATNFSRMLIGSVMTEGNRRNDDQLKAVAILLQQFVFGDGNMKVPERYFKGQDNGQNELQNERQQFVQERFNSVHDELNSRADNALRSTIDRYIDPKGLMSPYVRNNAVRDALDEVNTILSNDHRFKSLIDNHWRNAFNENFSQRTKEAILSAYKSKARTILKDVILKVRNEALKGSSATRTSERQPKFIPGKTTPSPARSSSQQSFADKVKANPNKRTLDLLNED